MLRVERGEDPDREVGRAAAVDEAEQRVQVHPAIARDLIGETRREAGGAQPLPAPGHEVLVGDLDLRHHTAFATAHARSLPRRPPRCGNLPALMRPLSSPVYEHRLLGRAETAIGLIFAIIASALNPLDAFVGLFVVAPVLTGLLYYSVFRRVARHAVADPAPAPTAARADPAAFARRLRWPLAAQVVVFLFFTATTQAPGLLGGIA